MKVLQADYAWCDMIGYNFILLIESMRHYGMRFCIFKAEWVMGSVDLWWLDGTLKASLFKLIFKNNLKIF